MKMKKIEIVTVVAKERLIDKITRFLCRVKIIKVIDTADIIAQDDTLWGIFAAVEGPGLIVKFLSFASDYRGNDVSTWDIPTDENGLIVAEDIKKL